MKSQFDIPQVAVDATESIRGRFQVLRLGMWSAWGISGLYIAYAAAVIASGVASGPPRDPYWAIAEVLTIVGVPIQVILFATIHECTPLRARIWSLLAFGWMLIWASLTTPVHFIELTVARRIDLVANPALAIVFDLGQPSLLLGIELLAWHFVFGLSMLLAAFAFIGRGRALFVRVGFMVGGVLCLLGLSGPIIGNPYLRSIGVIGYGVVFPIVCIMIGVMFKQAPPYDMPLPPRVESDSYKGGLTF